MKRIICWFTGHMPDQWDPSRDQNPCFCGRVKWSGYEQLHWGVIPRRRRIPFRCYLEGHPPTVLTCDGFWIKQCRCSCGRRSYAALGPFTEGALYPWVADKPPARGGI